MSNDKDTELLERERQEHLSKDIRRTRRVSMFRDKGGGPLYSKLDNSNSSDNLKIGTETVGEMLSNKSNSETPKSSVDLKRTKVNPDSLPHHTSLLDLSESQKPKKLRLQTPSLQDYISKYHSSRSQDGFEPVEVGTEESNKNLVRKPSKSSKSDTSLTDVEANSNKDEEHSKATTSAVSPNFRNSFFSLSSLKFRHHKNKDRKDVDETTEPKVDRDEVVRRQNLIQEIQPVTMVNLDTKGDPDEGKVIKDSLRLIKLLDIPRTFMDPAFDIVNRFCLEYTSLCVRTYPESYVILNLEEHYSRVFDFMQLRTDHVSTPVYEDFPGPETPILMARLFLNDFRIRKDETNQCDIYLPMFMHTHRLTKDKFKAMVTNIFALRLKYFQIIDVSRHGLFDLA